MPAIRKFIDYWLTRSRIRFAGSCVVVVALALLVCSFATAKNNRTARGMGLGADYVAFNDAGAILNRYDASRLYDLDLQTRLYHENLPDEPASVMLPFANAPFIAVLMRPFALLPYAVSYAAWIGVSVGLFLCAITMACKAAGLPKSMFGMALLISFSFEPFIIENLHGGQISAIGLFAVCGAVFLSLTRRPFAAGCALAICIYKPTLLPIILPMLVVLRQWRTIAGFTSGAIALGAFSVASVGASACVDYVHLLTGYAGNVATGGGGFQIVKFVDLNSFLKLLGLPSMVIWPILLAGGTVLARTVQIARPTRDNLALAWASAIACTLVLNIYVGIYDSILIIPAILLLCGKMLDESDDFSKLPRAFRGLLCAVWLLPWITGSLARGIGVQVFTIALAAIAIYALRMLLDERTRTALTACPARQSTIQNSPMPAALFPAARTSAAAN